MINDAILAGERLPVAIWIRDVNRHEMKIREALYRFGEVFAFRIYDSPEDRGKMQDAAHQFRFFSSVQRIWGVLPNGRRGIIGYRGHDGDTVYEVGVRDARVLSLSWLLRRSPWQNWDYLYKGGIGR